VAAASGGNPTSREEKQARKGFKNAGRLSELHQLRAGGGYTQKRRYQVARASTSGR
jgi:hypothetical protein